MFQTAAVAPLTGLLMQASQPVQVLVYAEAVLVVSRLPHLPIPHPLKGRRIAWVF
jgi:hypothetical protein